MTQKYTSFSCDYCLYKNIEVRKFECKYVWYLIGWVITFERGITIPKVITRIYGEEKWRNVHCCGSGRLAPVSVCWWVCGHKLTKGTTNPIKRLCPPWMLHHSRLYPLIPDLSRLMPCQNSAPLLWRRDSLSSINSLNIALTFWHWIVEILIRTFYCIIFLFR